MPLIKKIKIILFQPASYFSHLTKEQGVKTAFRYLAAVALFGVVMSLLVSLFVVQTLVSFFGETFSQQEQLVERFGPGALVLNAVVNYITILLLSFVGAAIVHVWLKLFGGKAPYAKTYQLSTYTGTPYYLLMWIPLLGPFIAVVYGLVLAIIGVQHTHGLSKTRALWANLLPLVLVILFLILLFFVASASLQQPALD